MPEEIRELFEAEFPRALHRREHLRLSWASLKRDEKLLERLVPVLEEWRARLHHPFWHFAPDSSRDRDQLGFLKATESTRLLSGGNRGGKSHANGWDLSATAQGRHPWRRTVNHRGEAHGLTIWVVSANYANLFSGVWKHFDAFTPWWCVEEHGPKVDAPYNMPRWVRLTNGTEVWWWSAEGQSRKKFQAAQVHDLRIDEEVGRTSYEELSMRLLDTGAPVTISATLVESEPWIIALEQRAMANEPGIFLARLSSEAAVRAGHLKPERFEEITRGLSKEDRDVRVYGHSRASHGLIYPEFDSRFHIRARRRIATEVARYQGIDPGWGRTAAVWGAVHPGGELEIYRELYVSNLNYIQVAGLILEAEGWHLEDDPENEGRKRWVPGEDVEPIIRRYIDPSAMRRETSGAKGIGHKLRKQGVYNLVRADNDVDRGIDSVREYLYMPTLDHSPKITFHNHLHELFKERASYRFRSTNDYTDEPAQKPVKKDDHLMDALRYLCVAQPVYREPNADLRRLCEAPRSLAPVDPARVKPRSAEDVARELMRKSKSGELVAARISSDDDMDFGD